MSIYTLIGIDSKAVNLHQNSNKHTVKTEKERKESSIFAKQLSSMVGESIDSKNIQSTLNLAGEGANLEELLGIYLSKTGKAQSAKITNADGQTETLGINSMTSEELKAFAKGDLDILKNKEQELGLKQSKKQSKNATEQATAENQPKADYQSVMFGGIAAQSKLKTYSNTNDTREFARTTKAISDMSDESLKNKVEHKPINPLNAPISVSNGDKIIANATADIAQIKQDQKSINKGRAVFNSDFSQESSKTRSLHIKNEFLEKTSKKKSKKAKEKVSTEIEEFATTKKTNTKIPTFNNNTTNTIKASNAKFLNVTAVKAPKATAVTATNSNETTTKVQAKQSENSKAADVINNNISQTNKAQSTLKENSNVINDTATKASTANNYAKTSELLGINSSKMSTDLSTVAKVMASNAKESTTQANINEENAITYSKNAEINEKAVNTTETKAMDCDDAALAYRKMATENAKIAMSMEVNTDEEFESISISQVLSQEELKVSEARIIEAERQQESGECTINKGDQYYDRGHCMAGNPVGWVLMRKGHMMHKKGRSKIREGSKKEQMARISKLNAENKIAEVDRQREKAQKDLAAGAKIEAEAKTAKQQSKSLEKTSKAFNQQSQAQTEQQKANEKAAASYTNVAKTYEEKATKQDNLATLNAAFADKENQNANEYNAKAQTQKNIGLKLDNVANSQARKQDEMATKVEENISKNDKKAAEFNENDKTSNKKEPEVEAFKKEDGAEKTDLLNQNESDAQSTSDLNTSIKSANTDADNTDNSMGLLTHADRTIKSHLVFGAGQREEKVEETEDTENNEQQNEDNNPDNKVNEANNNINNTQAENPVEKASAADLNIKKLG